MAAYRRFLSQERRQVCRRFFPTQRQIAAQQQSRRSSVATAQSDYQQRSIPRQVNRILLLIFLSYHCNYNSVSFLDGLFFVLLCRRTYRKGSWAIAGSLALWPFWPNEMNWCETSWSLEKSVTKVLIRYVMKSLKMFRISIESQLFSTFLSGAIV